MARITPRHLLATGAMGEVWLGLVEGPEGFRRAVVLKRARDEDEDARRALVEEARLSAALTHPNLVHVHELAPSPQGLVLVMEHLLGASLRTLVGHLAAEGATVPWPIAARIVADVARGLDAAHRALGPDGAPLGVVHRDVSPENLVTTEAGHTKVLDFGIARSRMRELTRLPTLKGKYPYLSPEQARGEPLDPRSDAFALGAVLVELLVGYPPFARASTEATLQAVLTEDPPPLGEAPAVIGDLARRLLAKRREHRAADLGAVADVLETLATPAGGRHRDVALFLEAEIGPLLTAQRARLRALFEPAPLDGEPTRVAELAPEQGTMAAIDLSALHGSPTEDDLTVPTQRRG
jgi:serine/threonine-protein kinase